jgi:septum formation protein
VPPTPPLVLASASPRRAELLQRAGIAFETVAADVDETQLAGEPAEDYVRRLAGWKAGRVAASHPGRAVLGADTTVVVDGEVFGKPADAADAARMLARLSGRSHLVLTGVCLISPDGNAETAAAVTTVEFRPLTADEISGYVQTGEPMDKAGAYAIQGGAAGFVSRLDGPYDNVVGLPVALIQGMCRARGIQVS